MPGKGKGKQKKKQQSSGQTSKVTKTVKQPEENELDSDIEKDIDDGVDLAADDNSVGNGEQEEVKSKGQEDKNSTMKDTTEDFDKLNVEDNVVETNGAVGNPPAEKKLTRKEMKKMKQKARKNSH